MAMNTTLAPSPKPNQSEINGIQARMAIWRSPLKAGSTSLSGQPGQAEQRAKRQAGGTAEGEPGQVTRQAHTEMVQQVAVQQFAQGGAADAFDAGQDARVHHAAVARDFPQDQQQHGQGQAAPEAHEARRGAHRAASPATCQRCNLRSSMASEVSSPNPITPISTMASTTVSNQNICRPHTSR